MLSKIQGNAFFCIIMYEVHEHAGKLQMHKILYSNIILNPSFDFIAAALTNTGAKY